LYFLSKSAKIKINDEVLTEPTPAGFDSQISSKHRKKKLTEVS